MAMLDFRQNHKGRSGGDRWGRRRLLLTILLLGIVVLLFDKVRQPDTWKWIDRFAAPSHEAPAGAIDNRLDSVPRSDLSADAFVVSKAEQPAEKPADDGDYFPGVSAGMFKSIRDDSLSSEEEQAVSLRLLNILHRTDLERLRQASVGQISYAQLFRQPGQYRGRLVTVSGTVRRANPIELFKNEFGLKKYYQVWLFPADNPTAPIVIYCLDLPKGFPTGMELAEDVEVTGFFLKRWAYVAQDVFRTAPELLAKTLEWQKQPVMAKEPDVDSRLIPVILVVSLLLALAAAWVVYMRTRPGKVALPEEPPDFDMLRRMDKNQQPRDPNVEDTP